MEVEYARLADCILGLLGAQSAPRLSAPNRQRWIQQIAPCCVPGQGWAGVRLPGIVPRGLGASGACRMDN